MPSDEQLHQELANALARLLSDRETHVAFATAPAQPNPTQQFSSVEEWAAQLFGED